MHAYSQDLRDRVLRALERGEGPSEIARRFEVSRMWVYAVRRRWEQEGQRSSLPIGGHRRSRIAHMEEPIRDWIKKQPDLTLAELCERLAGEGWTAAGFTDTEFRCDDEAGGGSWRRDGRIAVSSNARPCG